MAQAHTDASAHTTSSDTPIQQLTEAARSMQDKDSTADMLEKAVVAATEIIEGCDLAGMSIVDPHGIDLARRTVIDPP